MKKLSLYISLLSLLLLPSCSEENWFIHSVKYNGKVDKPEMVVTAQLVSGRVPVIYVSESVFFLDPNHNAEDTLFMGEYVYWERRVRTSFLRDAEVLMSVNGRAPVRLVGVERMDTLLQYGLLFPDLYSPSAHKQFAYTTDYVLQPGDEVQITVSHPRYPKPARVSQRMPMPLRYSVELTGFRLPNAQTRLAMLTLHLAPYNGAPSDLLCIRTTTYTNFQDSVRGKIWLNSELVFQDTVFNSYCTSPWVYSQDMSFAGYDHTNKSLSAGYYGATDLGLYRAVNLQEETLSLASASRYNEDNIVEDYKGEYYRASHCYIDSIVVDVRAVSRDEYLYCSSMIAAGYWDVNAYDCFASESGEDIIGDIQDIFDEMGSMEGIQLYSNVENAIGHVTAITPSVCTITSPTSPTSPTIPTNPTSLTSPTSPTNPTNPTSLTSPASPLSQHPSTLNSQL